MLLFTKHHLKAHGLFFFLLVVVLYRMYYISVTDVVGGNVMTEVQETTNLAILLCKCYCGTITACLLDFEHPVCYYCKTLFFNTEKAPYCALQRN